ncbi:MAG TPA: choice-of-anchor I family protein [Fluviicola sp.]|nr:choice-of-anchor I family protein [Fluviicola sp.]
MKKSYILLAFVFQALASFAQNPGLVISEVLANPNGTDNAFEWVELVATQPIDFSVTPYAVVVSNNGTATAAGWIAGGSVSYGFSITTGTVNTGDVVYVGGSTMLPTGTKLRVIDVVTTPGDGFGNAAAGVFGNGGANADGIAVFNMPIGSITNSSVPVDALFYGTGIGSALVSGGSAGYELPVNDRYAGGKLQTNSFFAGDPGSDVSIKATGFFNTATNQWFGQRAWSTQTAVNDNTTAISLGTVDPPGSAAISSVTQTVSETAGTAIVNVTFANANASPAKVVFGLSTYTNATQGSDFSWSNDTLVIPANTNGTFPFTIDLNNDVLAERTERIIVKLVGTVNANIVGNSFQIIYLTDNDYQNPAPTNELQMSLLTSFSNGAEGTNSAEIVAYDSTTYRLYIANSIGAKLDVVDFTNPGAPSLITSVSMAPYGNINSLAVYNGVVAVAVENTDPQANGSVAFFNSNGVFINQVTVGAMPDMITFNNDHTKIVVACEGEPKSDYSVDPVGSIAIVDLTPGYAALTNANVSIAGFTAYNGQEATLRAQGVRIFGPGSSAAQDFEPEYITIADDNQTAYVSLQENNAMAVVNLNTATVTDIRPLGLMDYSNGNNGLDASDQTAGIYISSIPAKGTFMPDALAHATIGGQEYIFSANEGDAREFAAITDVARLSATSLDATAFPDQNILKHNQFLGRLNALQATGDTDGDGDKDEIHLLGTRSFSIWNAATGALVFDSKDLLEQITATHPSLTGMFNASNSSGAVASKNRSDDKGPEPEGVATAFINGSHYLFVSLERVGGVMIFNIDNPAAPVYAGYYNNRFLAGNGPDRGAEGIIYISKEASPNNNAIVILANEVSSTLSVFQVNTCVELAGATITAADNSICAGASTTLSIPGDANSSVQWYYNDVIMAGQTGNSISASQAGDYKVYVSNTALSCADTTLETAITVNPLPLVGAGADQSICAGTSVTLSGLGAQAYTWNNGVTDNTAFVPASTQTYTVTGTDVNGCQNTDQVVVTVKPLPTVSAGADQTVCAGSSTTLSGSGAVSFTWNNGAADDVAFVPVTSQTYTVTGTGVNGCTNTDQMTLTVAPLPTVDGGNDQTVCLGETVTLNGSGAQTYTWTNAVDGTPFIPLTSATYTVTGTDANGCTNTDDVAVTVNELPVVNAGTDQTVCAGETVILDATGAQTYTWSNGTANGSGFVPAATATLNVIGTDANGCSNSDQLVVAVNPVPTVNGGADQVVCAGETVVLNANGAAVLQWNNGVTNNVGFSAVASQTYVVTGTTNGCEDTDTVSITVNALPTVDLGEDTVTCANYGPITLNAGAGFAAYQWNNNATTATTNALVTGTYSVTVTDQNGCQNSDAIVVTFDPCLGVDEQAVALVLFPNPTTGMLTVQSTSNEPMQVEVMNTAGQLLLTSTETNIDLSAAAAGTYLVRVQQGNTTQVFRIEKTN